MRIRVFLLEMFWGVPLLLAAGRPRDGCAQCVRLLEESLISIPSYVVPAPPKNPSGTLIAGAYRVDITPPPGFPMGGSGFAATFGRGYWTRLYARAFFFRDTDGQSLALVSCDLNAMAGGLQAKVAWRLSRNDLHLTRENLILTATHVHQGPGNFMSSKVYNDRGSPEPGFDPKLFDWLADQIASAVREAASRAKPAELIFKQGKVSELLRNRAPEPFLLNPDREEVLAAGPSSGGVCPEPFPAICPRYRAVDEALRLLEIFHSGKQVGSLVFLSVHPEAMSHETALYQSDFTGLAMSLLERRFPENEFVAGFFNGADGDISVRWKRQNRNEAVSFAGALLGWIDRVHNGSGVPTGGSLRVARTDIVANPYFSTGFPGSWAARPWCDRQKTDLCLAAEPLFGVATVGGAEDARTPLYDLGWKPGVRNDVAQDGQGVKQGAFESSILAGVDLTKFVAKTCYYPESFPVSLVSFSGPGALTFAAIPGEMTRTAWWRIRKSLEGKPELGPVVPLGLANEYVYYVTTREEFAAQGYEGAQVIFGPRTAEVIQATLERLTGELHTPVSEKGETVASAVYFPDWRQHHDIKLLIFGGRSGVRSFGPEWLGVARRDPDEGLENLIVDEADIPYRHWPRFQWAETGIDNWHSSLRSVQIRTLPAAPPFDDDRGSNVLTVYINPSDKPDRKKAPPRPANVPGLGGKGVVPLPKESGSRARRQWMSIWLAPKGTDQNQLFYFSVEPADHKVICSQSFILRDVFSRPDPEILAGDCP